LRYKQSEESAIKYSEKESFLKSFLLFFTVILLFLGFIFYDNARKEIANIRNTLFLEMKNYSLNYEDVRFHTKEVEKKKKQLFYTLYEDDESLYILTPSTPITDKKEMMMIVSPTGSIMVPYSKESTKVRKVWYPKTAYYQTITKMHQNLLWQFSLFGFGALILSLLAAWYTLNPLRSSLHLLEDFIKDIIHDLNTPLTSILLNLKMMETQNDEIDSIRTSVQTIEMLHQNLDAYLREQKQSDTTFNIEEIIDMYVTFFTPLYHYLIWDVHIDTLTLTTDKQAFERIIYNLLSNACKYNTSNGKIEIALEGTVLSIRNSSYGVKNPDRVFQRFYKESERGLGIGLHIVKKLCQTLGIDKKFRVEGTDVIVTLECESIMNESF